MSADLELKQIADEVAVCEMCKLHASRKLAVPGEGPSNASIVLIGEGPGFHENEQGRPFVGASGRFLSELLESIGLRREDVFICNVVKCRPPGNRDPQPDELLACSQFLERQIAAINPEVIVTLGRFSMARYFPKAKISAIHGQAKMIGGDGRFFPFAGADRQNQNLPGGRRNPGRTHANEPVLICVRRIVYDDEPNQRITSDRARPD